MSENNTLKDALHKRRRIIVVIPKEKEVASTDSMPENKPEKEKEIKPC